MRKSIACVCVLWCVTSSLVAQTPADSSKQLNDVLVTSNRVSNFLTGTKVDDIDSVTLATYRHQSLADMLSTQSQLFVKTYGPGSLATPSFRGGGAEQTAILWNGFNLQSPMYGQLDFSLMQADIIDNIAVQYGSSGALFGSGAVGGVIHLGNKPAFGSGLHASLNLQMGSFSNNKQTVTVRYGNKRYYTSLRVFNQYAKNDFPYNNLFVPGSPEMKQTNASFDQQGVMNDHYFMITPYQTINVRLWYQTSLRQLPPPMSVPEYKATQKDQSLRISGEWSWQRNAFTTYIRSAWFDERLVYEDSVSNNPISHNRAQTNITEAETKVSISKQQYFNLGVNNTFTKANVDAYETERKQNRSAVFASYKIVNVKKTLQGCVSIREELMDQVWLPVMPSIGGEWNMTSRIKLYGNVSRSYRVPTMNERFWTPGGNPDVKPESGWAEELSLNWKQQVSIIKGELTVTGYNRIMNDWIQWQPMGSYWSPQNVKQVWSRGAEGNLKLMIPAGKWNFSYTGRINYVLSTNEKLNAENDGSLHKQLIYVPRLNYTNQLSVTRGKFFVSFIQTYTGIRFTQTDNSDYLDYYVLGNLSAGKGFTFKQFSFNLNIQVNNIWNETYQVIKDRPMPGTNFLAGITITL